MCCYYSYRASVMPSSKVKVPVGVKYYRVLSPDATWDASCSYCCFWVLGFLSMGSSAKMAVGHGWVALQLGLLDCMLLLAACFPMCFFIPCKKAEVVMHVISFIQQIFIPLFCLNTGLFCVKFSLHFCVRETDRLTHWFR